MQTIPTDMSFGVSEDDGTFEWGSSSSWGFITKWSHLFSLWFWRLVFDIIRFNYFATDILLEKHLHDVSTISHPNKTRYQSLSARRRKLESIGEYLKREHYSEQFKRYYIIPMVAAPWCIDPEEFSRDFPADTLIHFM